MVDIVGLGQSCLDYLGLGEDYPAEDGKAEFRGLLRQGGGPVATALVCLSRLGRRTDLIGVVGDDPFARRIRAGLEKEGVGTDHLITRPDSASQFSFILVNPLRSTRTIHWTRATGAPLKASELPGELIAGARALHLDGLDGESSLAAARLAREAGVPVVLDIGTLRDHSLELIRLGDHVIVSQIFKESFAPNAGPEETVRRLLELGPKVAVVTLGPAGSVGSQGGEMIRTPSFRVRALDTTGAGDAFHGGYIHALLDGAGLRERMRLATAVAALSCTALGGRTALPTRSEVAEFLAAGPEERT